MALMRTLPLAYVHDAATAAGIRLRQDFPENGGTEVSIRTEACEEADIAHAVSSYLSDNTNYEPRALVADVTYLTEFGGHTTVYFKLA